MGVLSHFELLYWSFPAKEMEDVFADMFEAGEQVGKLIRFVIDLEI
eukprot:CAMPEP_0202963784 /NCGR_PEP_ID=MMETSP1396-20130829/7802_1 /ASSEMBLY_ACC=CAM_ASM_000872 /TAXON_ID= /ORGANISM="Pseudokeronopsis sp., Strain Brazil" /LENGTH=45 /DNA_ID= /DNA_START= /DNA_END= /DNA_ORIENTATION=